MKEMKKQLLIHINNLLIYKLYQINIFWKKKKDYYNLSKRK